MEKERELAYKTLEESIGGTPLYEFSLPEGHRIFAKAEYQNPTGSHYPRVYINLLKQLEEEGRIVPGKTPLIETSSGNAGSAFAWAGRELGYQCEVIVPPELPQARIDDIEQYGAVIRFSERGKYVAGAAEVLRKVLTIENKDRKARGIHPYWSPNHSQDLRSAESLGSIADEVLDTLEMRGISLDYYVAAVGNGATILGPGRKIKTRSPETRIVAWEDMTSGVAHEFFRPGSYQEVCKIEPGRLGSTKMYGTSVPDVDFPMLKEATLGGEGRGPVVDETRLVTETGIMVKLYKELGNWNNIRGALVEQSCVAANPFRGLSRFASEVLDAKNKFESQFTFWEETERELHKRGFEVGRSSAGSFAVARDIARQETEPKNFLVIFYDPAWKYRNGDKKSFWQKVKEKLVA